MSVIGAIASLFRGSRYVHIDEPAEPEPASLVA
jgi:hypothetical protein